MINNGSMTTNFEGYVLYYNGIPTMAWSTQRMAHTETIQINDEFIAHVGESILDMEIYDIHDFFTAEFFTATGLTYNRAESATQLEYVVNGSVFNRPFGFRLYEIIQFWETGHEFYYNNSYDGSEIAINLQLIRQADRNYNWYMVTPEL